MGRSRALSDAAFSVCVRESRVLCESTQTEQNKTKGRHCVVLVNKGCYRPAGTHTLLQAVACVMRDDSDHEYTQWHAPGAEQTLEEFVKSHQFPARLLPRPPALPPALPCRTSSRREQPPLPPLLPPPAFSPAP